MLSRVFAALGEVTLGYQVPDYTAYEDRSVTTSTDLLLALFLPMRQTGSAFLLRSLKVKSSAEESKPSS